MNLNRVYTVYRTHSGIRDTNQAATFSCNRFNSIHNRECFVADIAVAEMANREKMMKIVASKGFISTMADRIVGRFQPLQVVLFGSHARGTANAWSDVDLLVVLPDVSDKRVAAVDIRRTLGDLPVCKDIVVATPEEIARRGHLAGTVLRSALREGKIVYERA